MLSNNENAVIGEIGFDDENLNLDNLAALFEELELKESDLSMLKEKHEQIGNPENLGSVVKDVIWEQFVNLVKTRLGAEAADTFIKENNNLTLDLRESAHIQTAENFAEGTIATHNYISRDQLEQNYKRYIDTPHGDFRKQYVNPGMDATLERAGKLKKKGIDSVTDIYTGKQIPTETKLETGKNNPDAAQREHVIPSAELYKNPSLQMSNDNESLAGIINDPENLQGYTTAERNNRKSDKTADEMDEQDKNKHWEKANKRAEEFVEKKEKEGETRLKNEGRKTQKEEAFRVGKQALRAVLAQLLVDFAKEIIDKLVKWLKSAEKGVKTLLRSLKEAIESFVEKLLSHLINAGSTLIGTVASTIVGPVLGTIKRVWALLNQGFKAVAEAIAYICDPANKGQPIGRLLMEVSKIVIAAMTSVGATLLSEGIEDGLRSIPPFGFELPVIGSLANILGMFLGAVVAGIIGAIVINLINKRIAKQQDEDNRRAQMEKQEEIIAIKDQLLDVSGQRLATKQNNVSQSISARHKEAGKHLAEMLEEILDPAVDETQDMNNDELKRLLQGF